MEKYSQDMKMMNPVKGPYTFPYISNLSIMKLNAYLNNSKKNAAKIEPKRAALYDTWAFGTKK